MEYIKTSINLDENYNHMYRRRGGMYVNVDLSKNWEENTLTYSTVDDVTYRNIEYSLSWFSSSDVQHLPRNEKDPDISIDVWLHIDDTFYVSDHYNFKTGEWSLGLQPTHWTFLPKPPK